MKHKTALLTLAAASVLWSFSGVGAKCMSWNGFAIAGMRSLIAAVALLPVIRRPRLPRSRYQILAALSYAGLICLMILATKLTTAANAILLQFTAPVYSAVIGWFVLRERVTRRDIASIALMFAGLVLLLYDGLASGRMLGNVLALLSGVCSGAMNVFMRADPDVKPVQNVFWGNLAAAALTLPFWARWSGRRSMRASSSSSARSSSGWPTSCTRRASGMSARWRPPWSRCSSRCSIRSGWRSFRASGPARRRSRAAR